MLRIFFAITIFLMQPISTRCNTNVCTIYLVRHGQTDFNVQNKGQGHIDVPLNAEGEKQALVLKDKLAHINFSAVFSSDLARAHRTAELIVGTKQMAIIQTPALRERFIGSWEGRSWNDFKKKLDAMDLCNMPKDVLLSYKFDDIETYTDTYARTKNFILSHAPSYQNASILLCSHGGILRTILYHLDWRPGFAWHVSNAAILKIHVHPDGEFSIVEHDGIEATTDFSHF